jgi:hypothetical protein
MTIHPNLELLAAYGQGRLPAEQAAEIEQHLRSGCSQCTTEFDRLQRLATLLTDDASIPAMRPGMLQQAKELFRGQGPARRPGTLRRLIGSLVTPPAVNLAGVRQSQPNQQVLFTAEDYDVDVQLLPEPQQPTWQVVGQVLSRQGLLDERSLLSAALLPDNDRAPLHQHATGEFGEFDFTGVPAGTYTIRLRLAGVEILLPGLIIGEAG